MLTIYTHSISERLKYTFSIIFDDRKIDYQLTDNFEQFKSEKKPKLLYDSKEINEISQLIPSTVLFDETIQKYQIKKENWNDIEVLSFDGKIDIVASIFYVISLYDDYLQTEKDEHGRNIGKKSLLHQMGWLRKAMVDRWSENLISFIEKENKCTLPKEKIPVKILPTFDIDQVYEFRLRPKWRLFLAKIKDVLTQNKDRIILRKDVLNHKIKDPYDTFDNIKSIKEEGYEVQLFWLLGDYGKFDKNIPHTNSYQKEIILKCQEFSSIGLHPSYKSNSSLQQIKNEKKRLEAILDKKITSTRQHFLKIALPTTFERLEKAGFTDDYSLTYPDEAGFRAGTMRPFLWFNLTQNKISNLKLHPITYMEGTVFVFMGIGKLEGLKVIQELYKEVEKYGGTFSFLWHNSTINTTGFWKIWDDVWEQVKSF